MNCGALSFTSCTSNVKQSSPLSLGLPLSSALMQTLWNMNISASNPLGMVRRPVSEPMANIPVSALVATPTLSNDTIDSML